MCIALMDVRRMPLVGVRRPMISPSVVDVSSVYLCYDGIVLGS